MIVNAQKTQRVEVEIDPVSVLHDMEEMWKVMCRMSIDSEIRAGYWTREERFGHNTDTVRLRLATPDEIIQYAAFETVREVAREFN